MMRLYCYKSVGIRTRKFCTISKCSDLNVNPKFSNLEQQKILSVLNESNADQLSRFNVSQTGIKNLQKWKTVKGPFRSLSDILEVDGLGVKVVERLCKSIVTNDPTSIVKSTNTLSKTRRNILTPLLNNDQADTLSSAVALHLDPSGISWAKLFRDGNKLESWNYYDFSLQPKKMWPTDTFHLAVSILDKIPVGDIYVLEAAQNISPQGQKQAALLSAYNQQLELTSMLLALINTSSKHNPSKDYDNKVYYLRSKLPARLFRTLVGNERVSTTTTISNLLNTSKIDTKLPCSSITVDTQLCNHYTSQSAVCRELLGQALMLVVTFMDVCIYKNPHSLTNITLGKR